MKIRHQLICHDNGTTVAIGSSGASVGVSIRIYIYSTHTDTVACFNIFILIQEKCSVMLRQRALSN